MLKWIRHTARLMASALAARGIMWLAEPAQAGGYNVTLERVVVRAHGISAYRGVRKMTSTRMTATRALSMGAALAAGLLFAGGAQARYTAVDSAGTTNIFWHFVGYCDVTGDECDRAYTLPYKVSFSGAETNLLRINANGTADFVSDKLAVIQSIDSGVPGVRAFPNAPVATLFGEKPSLVEESKGCLNFGCRHPEADYGAIKSNTVVVTWFQCFGSTNTACYGGSRNVTLTPTKLGLDVVFVGGKGVNRVIPATFDIDFRGVPEPSAWALLVLGFGGIGATLRSRRRSRLQSA